MEKFKPDGEWVVFNNGSYYDIGVYCEVVERVYPQACIGVSHDQKANAHLIAAAPDMYRALEQLCSQVNQLDLCEAPQYALKALAKARGEQ